MDVIDRLAYLPTGERAGFGDTPLVPIVIRRASVVGEPSVPAVAPAPVEAPPAPGDGSGASGDGGQQAAPGDESSGETATDPPA
jgi:hypothetical protein